MTDYIAENYNKTIDNDINVYSRKDISSSTRTRYGTLLQELIKYAIELKVENIVISRGNNFPFKKNTMYFNTYTTGARYNTLFYKTCIIDATQDHSGNYSTSYSSQGTYKIYTGKIISSNNSYCMGMHGFIDNVYLLPSITSSSIPTIDEFKAIFDACSTDKMTIPDRMGQEMDCTLVIKPIDKESMLAETAKYRHGLSDMYTSQFKQLNDNFTDAINAVNSDKLLYPQWLIGNNRYGFHIYERSNSRKYRGFSYSHTIKINRISHRSYGVFNVSKVIKPYDVRVVMVIDDNDKFHSISLFDSRGLSFKHPHSLDRGLTGGHSFCFGSFSNELIGTTVKTVDDLDLIQNRINYILSDINASDLGSGMNSNMEDVNKFMSQIVDHDKDIQKYREKSDGWVIKDSKVVDNAVTVHDTDESYSGNDMDSSDDEF